MTLGFYFDGNNCVGCRSCSIACKDIKDLPVGTLFRRVFDFETGVYPEARIYHYSIGCNHCEKPLCVENCPVGSMQKAEDGTVIHDDATCIGCKTCMRVCPYGVPQFRESMSIVQKCDACADRRAAGKNPACVDACQMRALDFGDVDDLKAKYGEKLVSELPFLPSSDTTNPPTLINPKPASLAEDYRQIMV